MNSQAINMVQPVNWLAPLNRGRKAWWLNLPGISGGSRFVDLCNPGPLGNHGTLSEFSGNPIPVWNGPKRPGGYGSLYFDGLGAYVACGTNPTLAPPKISVSFWTKNKVTPAGFDALLGKTNGTTWSQGWGFYYNSSTQLNFFVGSYTVPAYFLGIDPTREGGNFVVGTYDGFTLRIYVNGVEGTPLINSPAMVATDQLVLGMQGSDPTYNINGWLDDVSIYDRALPLFEIQQLHKASRQGYPNELNRIRSFFTGVTLGIQPDAVSNSGYQAASASYSWSHTCTGTDRYLAVDVGRLSVPGTTVTGVTYNGVAMSLVGSTSTGTDAGRIECWGLANPESGSNTIAVTLSAVCISAGAAVSYTGVHQASPTEAYNGATATNVGAADATVTITSVADNCWIHGGLATDDANVTANQTTRNEVNGAGGSVADEDTGPKTPAGTQAMSYTDVAALATWTIGGYAIRPVAAASLVLVSGIIGGGVGSGAYVIGA